MPSLIALIPARGGSERVPLKNIRPLNGHPLIAYSIAVARQVNIFARVIVTTDSPKIAEIARYYGAETPFLRPAEYASSLSPDIEWIKHAFANLGEQYDGFSIIRPTSPFRTTTMILRAWQQLQRVTAADSVRAVELCKEHPGKMWEIDGELMRPLLPQSHLEVPWHDGQYQALPKVYVQNSALEIAWTRVVTQYNSRGGRNVSPFFTEGLEGFTVDYEEDWERAENLVAAGKAVLPVVEQPPFY